MSVPSSIGPYRVEREIGRGGMGVVYLARDTRLDRPVAIKALPEDLAADPERLQRFEREARVLASLNHPNIGAIYGLEESGGARYLILEHVEGESLAERIARGPLPLAEALDVCQQVAAGIEAAHEGGVIHRDLKPGNVMIAAGEVVKVLDFGLAKGRVADVEPGKSPTAIDSPTLANSPTLAQSPTLAHSPTLHSPATLPGVILGTAGYLSPEQARGKPVDRRTDIWSFGCVLYECLTGRMAFEGETVSDTIAKILERDVDWSALPQATPDRVRELLHRCFEKDPRRRLRDIGDARLALEEIRTGAGPPGAAAEPGTARPRVLGIGYGTIVAAAAGILVGIGLWSLGGGGRAGDRAVKRLSVTIPKEIRLFDGQITRDGRAILMFGRPRTAPGGAEPRSQIYLRRLDRPMPEPIRGTEGALRFLASQDGRWIAFVAPIAERSTTRRGYKVQVDGSAPPVPVCDWPESWDGQAAWLESGDILTPAEDQKEWVRIPTTGGTPGAPQPFDIPGYEGRLTFGSVLPRDRGVFLNATSYEHGAFHLGIGVLDLKSGKAKILIQEGGSPRYSSTGHLLFTRGEVLLAVPFDLGRLETRGEPAAILDGLRVGASWQNAGFGLSENGTLAYAPGGNVAGDRGLVVVGPGGDIAEWSGERQAYEASMDVSPDGARAAMTIANPGGLYEIWLSERGRTASRRVIAYEGADCAVPVWSPDGRRIAYSVIGSQKSDGIYVSSSDGSGAPILVASPPDSATRIVPTSWSPDGAQIQVTLTRAGKAWLGVVSGSPASGAGPAAIRSLFSGDAIRGLGLLSPDGRLLAHVSAETGRVEPSLVAYGPGGPEGVAVPIAGRPTNSMFWSSDGKRVYFVDQQEKLMAVTVVRGPRLSVTPPVEVLALDRLRIVPGLVKGLPDGRFLGVLKGDGEEEIDRLDLTLHFDQEIRARFAKAKR